MSDPRTLPLEGQVLQVIPNIDDYTPDEEGFNTERRDTLDPAEATVITSRVAGMETTHKVVLDVDLPAKLIPSTTEGHFHLYIDHELEWDDYVELLRALVKAGIVEQGYLGASEARGFTAARLPWVKKEVRSNGAD